MRLGALLLLCLINASWAFSQAVDLENYSLEETATPVGGFFLFGLVTGFPDAQFKEAMDSNFGGPSLGFTTSFGFNPYGSRRESPLLLGLDFTYHSFGRDQTTDPITSVLYKTSFNHYFVGPLARLYPIRKDKLIPFLEATAGLSILNTRIKTNEFDDSGETFVLDSESDKGFGYSIGIGFHTNRVKEDLEQLRTSFFMKLLYSWGDRSSYVKRDSVSVVDDVYSYETGYTSTNMLQVQVGVLFY